MHGNLILRLEKTSLALADADKALLLRKGNTKAMAAKAEALFNSGHFEQALVHYERASKMLKSEEIRGGLKKCRQAIMSVIGDGIMEFDDGIVAAVLQKKQKKKNINEFQVQAATPAKNKPRRAQRARLNISNILKEEEKFLKELLDMEELNVKINVRKGTRRFTCKVGCR